MYSAALTVTRCARKIASYIAHTWTWLPQTLVSTKTDDPYDSPLGVVNVLSGKNEYSEFVEAEKG